MSRSKVQNMEKEERTKFFVEYDKEQHEWWGSIWE